jgi:hypothetical protein
VLASRNVKAKAWSLPLCKRDGLVRESACPSVLMLVMNAPADIDVDVFIYA